MSVGSGRLVDGPEGVTVGVVGGAGGPPSLGPDGATVGVDAGAGGPPALGKAG